MEELNILLLCSSRIALPVIQQLAYFQQLKGLLIPDYAKDLIAETKQLLANTTIPVTVVTKRNFAETATALIREKEINTGLVFTFGFIIPPAVFQKPVKGFFNIHPGPLPQYRGADPVFYQIKQREKYAAITIHKLDEGLDSGDIVMSEKISLSATDTYGMLEMKLGILAQKQVETLTKILSMGFLPPAKKQDELKAHFYRRQEHREFTILWNKMTADDIIALINACNPYNKGAVTKINNKIIRLLHAEKQVGGNDKKAPAGTILYIDEERIEAAAINNDVLIIDFLSIDEGFVRPFVLQQMGLAAGMCFDYEVF
jgi:methionyl-tRNA formyltransferase